jgi:hypothetical protein
MLTGRMTNGCLRKEPTFNCLVITNVMLNGSFAFKSRRLFSFDPKGTLLSVRYIG